MVDRRVYTVKPIGVIHTPFKEARGVPIQASVAKDVEGVVEVYPEYVDGLKDLDGFSHIILIYYFHLIKEYSLVVKPYLDTDLRGLFSTRAPSRPNPIGLSVVRLMEVKGNILHVRDVHIVDGTPLLDIQPYIPEFDVRENVRIGWLEKRIHKLPQSKDDGRFIGR